MLCSNKVEYIYVVLDIFVDCRSPHCRPWKYNETVSEYYVIFDDKSTHRKSDTTRQTEETELEVTRL